MSYGIEPHPLMSENLMADVISYITDDAPINEDDLMVRYWDEVSKAVLTLCETYNLEPLYVIDEFCTDSDFPTDPNQDAYSG